MILFCLLGTLQAEEPQLRLQVFDQSGAGFPNVLVIVKSLEGQGEKFRALSDKSGAVETHTLAPGLYRIIATCPYGICETTVREFMVGSTPIHLELRLAVLPTQGDVVTVGPVDRCKVEVLDPRGKPISSAQILVRDSDARNEKWYTTGTEGTVTVNLPPGEVTIVVVHNGGLVTETLTRSQLAATHEVVTVRLE